MSMKYGFKTLLINPKGTTHSSEHNYIMRKHGLDKHTASAYLIALKGIESHMMIQKAVIYRFCPYTTTYTHSLVRSL